MTGTALALIAETRRIGLTLRVVRGSIRYRPVEKMPLELANRLKAHRAEVLAVLVARQTEASAADRPQCPVTSRRPPDEVSVARERPGTGAEALPRVRQTLDAVDREVLLACGVVPAIGAKELSAEWRRRYEVLTARLDKMPGVCLERAEAMALHTVLREMLAVDELRPEEW